MIGKLKGILDSWGDDYCILDVGGVGYQVYVSSLTREHLPQIGEAASLHIETIVREDLIRLYGFASEEERAWYRLLTSVQGVGAKVALAILSTLSPQVLSTAILTQNKGAISKANGVGPKVAERICIELKNKTPVLSAESFIASAKAKAAGKSAPVQGGALQEALSALINLGYTPADAQTAVMQALSEAGEDADVQTLIRGALKGMGR